MRRATVLPVLILIAVLVAPVSPAGAAGTAPWRSAQQVTGGLADARTELIVGSRADAETIAQSARRAYRGDLRRSIAAADPDAGRAVRTGLDRAVAAARRGDEATLAAAGGAVAAGLLRGSYAVTDAAVGAGDAATAREWLLLRDFRTATRFTRPGTDATDAVRRLREGTVPAADARAIVRKDLLDAYQARLRTLLGEADRGEEQDFPTRRAESAAQAAGLFAILADRYRAERGAASLAAARSAFAALEATAAAGGAPFRAALKRASATLEGFTAAPFGPGEAARRAQQLLRFLALVPVEYGRGVADGRVTKDFEIQEAVTFQDGTQAAFVDLQSTLARRDAPATAAAETSLAGLQALVTRAERTPKDVAAPAEVERVADDAERSLRSAMPASWLEPSDESDYDLIALTLDRMEASAGAGQYQQAEQARLEAYAFFEFGPERRLKSFDPGLATTIEGLIWFGADGQDGLAKLIAQRAPLREIKANRTVLDERLGDAAATLGDSANPTTVITNSAIIVFREGLEAVLILAAITASFVGARRRMRRPVLLGAALGLVVSVVTWVLAQTVMRSLEQYGEKLEAIVGLIAIGVLLLITNWFFHRVYWSEWIGKFHRRRRQLERLDGFGVSFISAQAVGLMLLGLTSVYREGFETVLFLQSLQLSAGTPTVLAGAALGLALTLAVGAVVFLLERKLPYKKMLIVTGVFIGFVLVVMVGQTARTMQGTGWLPITPIDVEVPSWIGLWFGVFPTWETVGAQLLAAAFVIGSYYLAQEVRVKRPRRRATSPVTQPEPPAPAPAEAPVSDDRVPAQARTS